MQTRQVVYKKHNIIAPSRNYFCNGNATTPTTYIAELHVSLQYKSFVRCTNMLSWPIYDTRNNKTYLDFRVICPILLSDFNQICCFSADFHMSPQHRISRKFFEWEPSWYMRRDWQTRRHADRETDRHEEANRRYWRLTEHIQKATFQSTTAILQAMKFYLSILTFFGGSWRHGVTLEYLLVKFCNNFSFCGYVMMYLHV